MYIYIYTYMRMHPMYVYIYKYAKRPTNMLITINNDVHGTLSIQGVWGLLVENAPGVNICAI